MTWYICPCNQTLSHDDAREKRGEILRIPNLGTTVWPRKEVPRIDPPPIYSPSNIVAYFPLICGALQYIELLAVKSTASWLTNTNTGLQGNTSRQQENLEHSHPVVSVQLQR